MNEKKKDEEAGEREREGEGKKGKMYECGGLKVKKEMKGRVKEGKGKDKCNKKYEGG